MLPSASDAARDRVAAADAPRGSRGVARDVGFAPTSRRRGPRRLARAARADRGCSRVLVQRRHGGRGRARGAAAPLVASGRASTTVGDAGRLFYHCLIAICAPGMRDYLGVDRRARGRRSRPRRRPSPTTPRSIRAKRSRRGSTTGWWQLLALRGELLEIGRLQYHSPSSARARCGPVPWYDDDEADPLGPGFRRGDVAGRAAHPRGAGLHARGARRVARSRPRGPGPGVAHGPATAGDVHELAARRPARRVTCPPRARSSEFQRRFTMVPGGTTTTRTPSSSCSAVRAPTLDDASPARPARARPSSLGSRAGGHWRARTGWFDFDAPA